MRGFVLLFAAALCCWGAATYVIASRHHTQMTFPVILEQLEASLKKRRPNLRVGGLAAGRDTATATEEEEQRRRRQQQRVEAAAAAVAAVEEEAAAVAATEAAAEAAARTAAAPPVESVAKEQEQPPPSTKKKGIWQMTAQEQRVYLTSMHPGAGPSSSKADAFSDAAKATHAPVQPRSPVKDGTSWRYDDIAGRKDVLTPFGHPTESIFVLTASYRDPEVASTIARAYARAAHPERVVIGVHAQNSPGDEEAERDPIAGLVFAGVECPAHPVCAAVAEGRVRVSRELWQRAEGPTVARALAEKHYRGETYAMGVDSHCHFVRGWDNVMIDMFKRIGNDHALISAYPTSYSSREQGGDGMEPYEPPTEVKSIRCIRSTRRVNVHNTISFKHDMGTCATPQNGPVRVAFFAAGFTFARGHRVLRVPYDPHTPYVFDGEEISMGVRAWTWGYDLYQPDRNIIAHLYIPAGSSLRPVFWTTDWGARWPCQYRSILRIQQQLRIHETLTPNENLDMVDMEDWDLYDSGPRRDPRLFFAWAKLRLKNEWGEKCKRVDGGVASRAACSSASLDALYKAPGGMPWVPWKEGTENIFPPMVLNAGVYPPPKDQFYLPQQDAS